MNISTAGPEDLDEIRAMLHEYAAWVETDLCFQGFGQEVATLPGAYAPPSGALLIARNDDQAVGMVALRRKDDERCEMKRLYVRPEGRGTGLGSRLIARIVDEARARGYREMYLDTLPIMSGAQRLYEQVGFEDVPPYYDSPIVGTRFMMKPL